MNDTVGWDFTGWAMQDGTQVSDANGNLSGMFQGNAPTWSVIITWSGLPAAT